jgi:hypothetical protein
MSDESEKYLTKIYIEEVYYITFILFYILQSNNSHIYNSINVYTGMWLFISTLGAFCLRCTTVAV